MRRPALPISLYLPGPVLLVADGDAATKRKKRLMNAGADVTVVAPADFKPAMCTNKSLVMVHADDALQHNVAEASRMAGAMTYAHDMPDLSDFAMPAMWSEGPLKIAISTDAMAPALSRRIREQLDLVLGSSRRQISLLIEELSAIRNTTKRGSPIRSNLYKVASRFRLKGTASLDD